MTPTCGRLSWIIQKNRHLIDSLVLRRAPKFVYQHSAKALRNEIPVFTFHVALPDLFEKQCQYLVRNGYQTLSAKDFQRFLEGNETNSRTRSVMLTFDDGLKHVWSVAFPILKKYGLRATCFLIPGCIPEKDELIRPNIADVWEGKVSEAEVVSFKKGESPLATWEEIRRMYDSGVIEFHSHTLQHALVPISDKVFNFAGPHYDPYFYCNIHIPLYTKNNKDVTDREPIRGLPIFYSLPRMQAARRFFPDEGLISECINFVSKNDQQDFFQRPDWRHCLNQIVEGYKDQFGQLGRYETIEERDNALRKELKCSREEIERQLPNCCANHLCYPWYSGAPFAVQASREAGFEMNYFGHRRGRPTNRPGQDPFGVVRVDELFLERLPGNGRMTIKHLFKRMVEIRSIGIRLFSNH